MKKNKAVLSMAVVLVACAISVIGCSPSRPQAPTNADLFKAVIERALNEKCSVHVPSIVILGSASNKEDATWSYAVRYACLGKSGPGQSKSDEREMTVRLRRSQDSAGNTVWVAR